MIIELDLNKITSSYQNKQSEWIFIKNAIKSAIVDAKIENGQYTEIVFIERKSDNIPFDLAINGTANKILSEWEMIKEKNMYTFNILNGERLFLKVKIDFKSNEVSIIEKRNDRLLDAIFYNDFTYSRVISFLESRTGKGIEISELIERIKETKLKSFDDDISVILVD